MEHARRIDVNLERIGGSMLALGPERLEEALGRLEPTHRALLELSLHREVADPALAELLRTDADTVADQRSQALGQIAHELEASPRDVEEALVRHWRGEPEAIEPEPAAEEPEHATEEPERVEEPQPMPTTPVPGPWSAEVPVVEPARRSRRGFWYAVTGLAAVGLILILVFAGGGDDEADEAGNEGAPVETPGQQPPRQQEPAPPEGPEPVELQPVVGASGATGTARIVEPDGQPRLEVRVQGVSEENYAVWLYDSIGEARPVASFDGPRANVRFRLPDGYEGFRYLDISREPSDGNPNHSGESVLRILTEDLPAG